MKKVVLPEKVIVNNWCYFVILRVFDSFFILQESSKQEKKKIIFCLIKICVKNKKYVDKRLFVSI